MAGSFKQRADTPIVWHSAERSLPSPRLSTGQSEPLLTSRVSRGKYPCCWKRGRNLPLVLSLLLWLLSGCQSLPAPHSDGGKADSEFVTALSDSIGTMARQLRQPEALQRTEVRHRRLLATRLPALLEEAKKNEHWKSEQGHEAENRDSPVAFYERDQIAPIVKPSKAPSGLERAGIGVPLVIRRPAPDDPNAPRAGYHLPATLVAQPGDTPDGDAPVLPKAQSSVSASGSQSGGIAALPDRTDACCQVTLVDSEQVERVPTPQGELPVAMDLLAPITATHATGTTPMAAIANLLRPGRFTETPRIVFLHPYKPDKIPVVLVHGLLSTPGVWKPLVTELLADPRIRDCCQLWFFYYPTGQPVPLSALQLREALDDAVARTRMTGKMILIGHSMGGILSRAQVSRLDPERAERVLPGVTGLSQSNRVRRALVFEPRTDVSRVVFLFVPHRGSALASNSLGAFAIRLIRLPDVLLNETEYAFAQLAGHESRRMPTSIQGLSPRSPFLRVLSTTTPTVPTHSIIGNRGRGDGRGGSDGVVPVRSARVASAESELVVPTGHGGFDHPAAVAEIKRIILLDAARQQADGGTPGAAEPAVSIPQALGIH